jgi:Tol biopolymer transport system component
MVFSLFAKHAPFTIGLVVACTLACSTSASAQYFGQNKVRYKPLTYQTLKTEHFEIYFTADSREAVEISARLAERWYARLTRVLEHKLTGVQPLVIYASHPDFEQTNVIPGRLGESTGGVTESLRRRIVLPLAGPLADTDHVIGHELVHAFQFDMASVLGTRLDHLPLWFIEGMAEYCSLGAVDANTAMWVRDAVMRNALPTIDRLDNPAYFPYRWGQAFWAYVAGRWGDPVVRRLFMTASWSTVDEAIEQVLGRSSKVLSEQWHDEIRQTYALKSPNDSLGPLRQAISRKAGAATEFNVGSAISPDGRRIAFLSGRGLLSIDLYLADAVTGRILRKLTNTAASPHLSSLQFIRSAGAWNPAGDRLVVATMTSGRPTLNVFDAETGRLAEEFRIPDVDEILNPTWAPDGHAIGFTGMSEGFAHLYVYDITAKTLQRLTHGIFADLQPAWSPDGRRIAFATDRFGTQPDTLEFGSFRLAIFDLAAGTVEPLAAAATGNNFNPQWSADGQMLYFISDRTSISNLYRVHLPTGDVTRLTDVATGVRGVTSLSPAMSIASKTNVISFSLFERGGYDIYVMDGSSLGTPVRDEAAVSAVLPPRDRRRSELATLLARPEFGLPPVQEREVTDYDPKLALESAGQPTVGVGTSQVGGAAAQGGTWLTFGDMLNDRQLVTMVELNGASSRRFSFAGMAGQLAYFNQSHRWSWGLAIVQNPYVSEHIVLREGSSSGDPVMLGETILLRTTERSASLVTAYPFNHGVRLETAAGASHISFDRVVESDVYSLATGLAVSSTSATTALAEPLALGTSTAALIVDTASFGATSPVQGQRGRLEARATAGTIAFVQLLADYRRYFMPVPFYTVAVRAIHDGRYGSGAEDPRLFQTYIGDPRLIHGYEFSAGGAGMCPPSDWNRCLIDPRLLGSRVFVANLEFRLPLLRPFGLSQQMYGPVPVELAVFADAGSAWNQGDRPAALGGSRAGVFSAGVAARTNVSGLGIIEFAVSRPRESARGWVFQMAVNPGF